MNIYVFGANGMLGNYVVRVLRDHYSVVPITRSEVDLNDDFNLITQKYKFNPDDIIINAAGIIPHRKKSLEEMIRVNALFPLYLANLSCRTIHITTDCVFSGREGGYHELSPHDCTEEYGKTKSLGEDPRLTIIRTSIIGEEQHNKLSLLEWARSSAGGQINGYTTHYWNGLTCLELAKQIKRIIDTKQFWTGERHYHSGDRISKYELLCMINDVYELNLTVQPVESTSVMRDLQSLYKDVPVVPSYYEQLREMKEYG